MFNLRSIALAPHKTGDRNNDLYTNNLFYLKVLNLFRSMYFVIPVWVSMELKYISFAEVAMIDMVILLSGLLLELPTGALADLVGRKITITTSFFITAAGYLLFAYADNFTLFLIAGLCFGLADALLSGSLEALVFDTLKQSGQIERFSEIINRNQVIFNYGIVFSTIIGGLLFANFYHLPSILTACAFAMTGIVSTKFIEPDIDSEKFTLRNYLLQSKKGFKELFKSKQTRDFSLFYVLVGALTWPIILSFKNFALTELGVSEINMGYILAFLSLVSVQFLHLLIRKKVFEQIRVVFMLPAISLSVFLPLSYFYSVNSMVLIIFAVFVTSAMRWNILSKFSNQCYSSKNRATAISSLSMMISIIYVGILLIFSFISKQNPLASRSIFLGMSAVSILLLLPIAIKLTKEYHGKTLEIYD